MTSTNADVVVLTALSEEYDAVVSVLGLDRAEQWRGHAVGRGQVGGAQVLAVPMGGAA
jgi:hypothetical protein